MWVIMSQDGRCVVKGKTKKYLCGIGEPTRKEPVSYETEQRARSALMRMFLLKSCYADAIYGDAMPKLTLIELDAD